MCMKIEGREVIGRVECLGEKRPQFEARMDKEHGAGNWGYGWLVEILDSETGEYVPTFLDKEAIIHHYLNAYVLLATRLPHVFTRLVEEASEVFELDPEVDLLSGTDFHTQKSVGTHYMDIAVRVVLEMNDLSFKGNQKVNINHGGDELPVELRQKLAEDLGLQQQELQTWFDIFNPSRLSVGEDIRLPKDIKQISLLTNPCPDHWAERVDTPNLTAESLYQFSRVVWVKAS